MSVSSKSGIFAYDGYLDGAIRGGSHSGETDAKAIEVAIGGGYILKTGIDTLGFGFRLAYYLVLAYTCGSTSVPANRNDGKVVCEGRIESP